MEILMEELCYWICRQCFKILDACMSVFNAITGISDVWDSSEGKWTNLVTIGITDSAVTTMLWAIFIVGVFLACLFAIVAIIRNMMTNKTSTGAIAGKLCISLVGTIAVFALVILGVMVANELLQILAMIFGLDDTGTLSKTVFNSVVGNAWRGDHSIEEITDWDMPAKDVLGSYSTSLGFWPKTWKEDGYINADKVSWLCMLIGAVGVLFFIVVAALNMARRLFELVYIYLCLPAAMSTIPLDDGARMKNWTDAMIARFLQVYGCVFAIGVYSLLSGIVAKVSLVEYEFDSGNFFWDTLTDGQVIANAVLQVILLVGGAMCIPQGQNLFMRLFGGREDMRMTWGAGRMVAGAVRSVGRAAATVGTAGVAAGVGFVGGAIGGVKGAKGGDSAKASIPQSSETQINDAKTGASLQGKDGSQDNSSDGGFKGSGDESKIGDGTGASGGESGGSQTENSTENLSANEGAKDNTMTEPGAERNIADGGAGETSSDESNKSKADIKAENKAKKDADKAAKAKAKEAKAHQKQINSETPYKYQEHNTASRILHYAAKGAATGASTAFHMVAMTGLLGKSVKAWDANHMAKRAANKKAENEKTRDYVNNGFRTPTQVREDNEKAERAAATEKAQEAKAQATRDETQNRILTEMHEMNAKLDNLKNPAKPGKKPEGDE